jgi:hypothetical protein
VSRSCCRRVAKKSTTSSKAARRHHGSLSTPEALRLHTCDFHNWVTVSNARGMPAAIGGTISAGHAAGLGVTLLVESFGAPILALADDPLRR